MEPLRGDVWDAHLSRVGDYPVVIVTINVLIPRLSAVMVAVVTGTEGPAQTHVPLDRESGLTGYDVSFVDFSGRPGCEQGSDLGFHVACMCVT